MNTCRVHESPYDRHVEHCWPLPRRRTKRRQRGGDHYIVVRVVCVHKVLVVLGQIDSDLVCLPLHHSLIRFWTQTQWKNLLELTVDYSVLDHNSSRFKQSKRIWKDSLSGISSDLTFRSKRKLIWSKRGCDYYLRIKEKLKTEGLNTNLRNHVKT